MVELHPFLAAMTESQPVWMIEQQTMSRLAAVLASERSVCHAAPPLSGLPAAALLGSIRFKFSHTSLKLCDLSLTLFHLALQTFLLDFCRGEQFKVALLRDEYATLGFLIEKGLGFRVSGVELALLELGSLAGNGFLVVLSVHGGAVHLPFIVVAKILGVVALALNYMLSTCVLAATFKVTIFKLLVTIGTNVSSLFIYHKAS
jgi:hypothetical protein